METPSSPSTANPYAGRNLKVVDISAFNPADFSFNIMTGDKNDTHMWLNAPGRARVVLQFGHLHDSSTWMEVITPPKMYVSSVTDSGEEIINDMEYLEQTMIVEVPDDHPLKNSIVSADANSLEHCVREGWYGDDDISNEERLVIARGAFRGLYTKSKKQKDPSKPAFRPCLKGKYCLKESKVRMVTVVEIYTDTNTKDESGRPILIFEGYGTKDDIRMGDRICFNMHVPKYYSLPAMWGMAKKFERIQIIRPEEEQAAAPEDNKNIKIYTRQQYNNPVKSADLPPVAPTIKMTDDLEEEVKEADNVGTGDVADEADGDDVDKTEDGDGDTGVDKPEDGGGEGDKTEDGDGDDEGDKVEDEDGATTTQRRLASQFAM